VKENNTQKKKSGLLSSGSVYLARYEASSLAAEGEDSGLTALFKENRK
jgi:hypothetical protein